MDDPDSIEAIREWSDQLAAYIEGQSVVESVRSKPQGTLPWPERDNPMLGYLLSRAGELSASDGFPAAMLWLAVHAWFEGAIDERARCVRYMTA